MTRWWLDTRDRPAVLWAFLEHFAADSVLVLKGTFADLPLLELPGAQTRRRAPGTKQTSWPELDVIELPLSQSSIQALKKILSGPHVFSDPGVLMEAELIHGGVRVFLAGDSFHRECVSAMSPTPESLLQSLVEKGVIRSYVAG